MVRLPAAVHRDIRLDLTAVVAVNRLDDAHAESLRDLLHECVAECPTAVIVELPEIANPSAPVAAAIVQSAAAIHHDIPSVDLMVCGPSALGLAFGSVPVHPNREEAHAVVQRRRSGRNDIRWRFDHSGGAPAVARRVVRDSCASWSIDHVAADAQLIISELVANTIRHTANGGVAAIGMRDRFLHLAVEDADPRPLVRFPSPVAAVSQNHGRGLGLVARVGSSWGHRVDYRGHGKVVWAVLPTTGMRAQTHG